VRLTLKPFFRCQHFVQVKVALNQPFSPGQYLGLRAKHGPSR